MRTEEFGDITVTDDGVTVKVAFPVKPTANVRAVLRGHAFKQASALVWTRPCDPYAWPMGKLVAARACHAAAEIL